MVNYFFDTYALIEVIENNPLYLKYSSEEIITFNMNIIEAYMHFFRTKGEKTARKLFYELRNSIIQIPDEVVFEAIRFKHNNRKIHLSYVDCLGYKFAILKGIKFLTGDKEFKGMKGVEFVK